MAKPRKPRKSAPRAPFISSDALRTTALRVGVGVGVIGLGAGLYALQGHRPEVAILGAPRAVAAMAPAKPVVAEIPHAAESPPPTPPRREASAESYKPMSAAMRATFDSWLMATYAKCWRAPKSPPDADPYLPKVRVAFKEDGGLASPPRLVNPPSDRAWRAQAEAALKAVKGCDPLHVPDKYAEYYPSWKSRTVYFDPTRN